MKNKKDIGGMILALIALVCVADLLFMTFSKARQAVQGTAEATEAGTAVAEQAAMETSDVAPGSLLEQQDLLAFEGQTSVSAGENPWKTNAGIIETEEMGQAIFLTPNTAFSFSYTPKNGDKMDLEGKIFPSVQKVSDGCSLLIRIFDEDGQALASQKLDVTNEDKLQKITIDFSEWENQRIMCNISCGNGGAEDAGDWMMLTTAKIDA